MLVERFVPKNDILMIRERPTVESLAQAALEDSYSRLPENPSPEAVARIEKAIRNRFTPAVEESQIIADQFNSPEYIEYTNEIGEFLNWARIGTVFCPDGRKLPYLAFGDRRIMVFHQRLGGKPQVRPSSKGESDLTSLDDPNITGNLISAVRKRRKKNPQMELVEFLGPHFHSDEPEHGCGAMKLRISEKEQPSTGMRFGGVDVYYDDLAMGFYAFDNMARTVKDLQIPSTTFDLSHDVYSQGLVFGLRSAYSQLNPEKSFRENLLSMHSGGRLVMTERLDEAFKSRIHELALNMYGESHKIENPLDPTRLAQNTMKIGRIAKAITQQEEENGFNFLPDNLVKDVTQTAKRVLAYTLIRNLVYRQLADIRPGNHPLLKHNEEWIRVGSNGPLNIDHVSFVLMTSGDELSEKDIEEIFALEGILRNNQADWGIKPNSEAALIVVGETFDPSIYASPEIAQNQKDVLYASIGNKAAKIRVARPNDIKFGNRVVLGAIFNPDRTIAEIVR